MSDQPLCFMCRRPHHTLGREVSRVSIVRGEGLELFCCMLCRTCEDKLVRLALAQFQQEAK